VNPRELHTSTG